MKRRLFEIMEVGRPGDRASRAFDVLLALLIVLNVAALILGSVEGLYQAAPAAFRWFEAASVVLFSIEYGLRIWVCTAGPGPGAPAGGRLRFILSPVMLIDLAAILPFYLFLLAGMGGMGSPGFRVARLLARAARLGRYSRGLRTLAAAFQSRAGELLSVLLVMGVLLVLASAVMFFAENAAQPEKFASIPAAMWWSVITLTTVGYGDVAPVTVAGRVVAGVIAILGVGLFAIPAGILGSGFVEQMQQRKSAAAVTTCPHCGREIPRE